MKMDHTKTKVKGHYGIKPWLSAGLAVLSLGLAVTTEAAQQAKLNSSDRAGGDEFGFSVAIDGDYAVVGAPKHDGIFANAPTPRADSGHAYVFRRVAGVWSQIRILVPDDVSNPLERPRAGDEFGSAVSISGDTIAVGAPHHKLDQPNPTPDINDVGVVYVFRDTSGFGDWSVVTETVLYASDLAGADEFGTSVDIQGDVLVAGAPLDDDGGSSAGSAYFFLRTAGVWAQQDKVNATDPAANKRFGNAVAIDGLRAAIGAYLDGAVAANSGAVYVFMNDGLGNWSQEVKLKANDAANADHLGASVDISGTTIVAGADLEETNPLNSAGAAYIFNMNPGWVQEAKLQAPDQLSGDLFGTGVSIQGNRVMVGAPLGDQAPINANTGSAYIFQRTAAGPPAIWTYVSEVNASDALLNANYGRSVGQSGDSFIIGANLDNHVSIPSGSAYVNVETPLPTPSASPTPSSSPTPGPSVSPTSSPTVAPSTTPTSTIAPTLTPTVAATATVTSTNVPTNTPSATPGASVTPSPTAVNNLIIGYHPDDDSGNANIFYNDPTPFAGIRSYVIRFRRITAPGIDERKTVVSLPGGPAPVESYQDIFALPLEDLGIPTSWEFDMLIKVEARPNPDGTGPILYQVPGSGFLGRQHPSANLKANTMPDVPPFIPYTPTTLISTDSRPTAQQNAYAYDVKLKFTGGPMFGTEILAGQFTHNFPGMFTNWDQHTTSTEVLSVVHGEGPQQFWVAPKKGYNASNGAPLGRWQISHKSPNINFLAPTVTP